MVYPNMDSYVGLLLRSSIINVASAVMGVDGWIFETNFIQRPIYQGGYIGEIRTSVLLYQRVSVAKYCC